MREARCRQCQPICLVNRLSCSRSRPGPALVVGCDDSPVDAKAGTSWTVRPRYRRLHEELVREAGEGSPSIGGLSGAGHGSTSVRSGQLGSALVWRLPVFVCPTRRGRARSDRARGRALSVRRPPNLPAVAGVAGERPRPVGAQGGGRRARSSRSPPGAGADRCTAAGREPAPGRPAAPTACRQGRKRQRCWWSFGLQLIPGLST